MNLSVIVPTNREGAFSILFRALAQQTLAKDDWQLILVDDYPANREQTAYAYQREYRIENFKYMRGKPNYWRSNRLIANARNTGLVFAQGELIVFLDDYCWTPPTWLEEHWKTYKQSLYTMLGGMKAVKYAPEAEHIDLLPPPQAEPSAPSHEELMKRDTEIGEESAFMRNIRLFNVSDTRGSRDKKDCTGGWLYSCNASVPLKKLIEVNGFEERYDLCSEEDIGLGLMLERVGCRFWYRPDYSCTIFHMDHTILDKAIKANALFKPKYKPVRYGDLRKRGKLDSELDEVQLILKEAYNVKYDGSWGLHEWMRRRPPVANIVDGKKVFDLKAEREKRRLQT